jgi:hypothetical protein
LNSIKASLESPPQKPDVIATMVSVLSALLVVVKILIESAKGGVITISPINVAGLLIASSCAGFMIARLFRATRNQHHDNALKDVNAWIKRLEEIERKADEAAGPPTSTPPRMQA